MDLGGEGKGSLMDKAQLILLCTYSKSIMIQRSVEVKWSKRFIFLFMAGSSN